MSGVAIFFSVLFSMLGLFLLIVVGLVVYSHWNENRRKRLYWARGNSSPHYCSYSTPNTCGFETFDWWRTSVVWTDGATGTPRAHSAHSEQMGWNGTRITWDTPRRENHRDILYSKSKANTRMFLDFTSRALGTWVFLMGGTRRFYIFSCEYFFYQWIQPRWSKDSTTFDNCWMCLSSYQSTKPFDASWCLRCSCNTFGFTVVLRWSLQMD